MDHRLIKMRKRNRMSFACQECRRRKTKCDKKRPGCGRCVAAGFACTYASMNGVPADELRLANEVRAWETNKAARSGSNTKTGDINGSATAASTTRMDPCSYEGDRGLDGIYSAKKDDMTVNFCDTEDTIASQGHIKYLHKPFSVVAMMQRDHFARALAGSVTGFTLGAIDTGPSNETFNVPNCAFKVGAAEIPQDKQKDTKDSPVQIFLEDILKNNVQANERRNCIDFGQALFFPTAWNLEDNVTSVSAYPIELLNLLFKIENLLPEIDGFKYILDHFYEVIYPVYPLLDVPSFEKIIHEMLRPPTNHKKKYKISLGTNRIRYKLENLTILLIILKISHTQLTSQFNSKKSHKVEDIDLFGRNQVNEEVITIAQKCLSLLSAKNFMNENYLCCLLHLWIYEALSQGSARLGLISREVLMLGTISHLAVILGLHKDPSGCRMLLDTLNCSKSLLNYRRKLWVGIVSIRMNELLPCGSGLGFTHDLMNSFSKSKRQNKESYMSSVIRDVEQDSAFDIPLHEINYKEYQLQHLWIRLNLACNSLNEPTALSKIEKLVSMAEDTLLELFPLSDILSPREVQEGSNGIMNCTQAKVQIDYAGVRACKSFINNLLGRLIVLNITTALTIHFENLCREEPAKYLDYYQKFLVQFFRRSLELVKVIRKLLSEDLDNSAYSKYEFAMKRITMLSLLRTMVSVCLIILRLSFSEQELRKSTESESILYEVRNSSGTLYRLQMVVKIKANLVQSLKNLVLFASKLSNGCNLFYKGICVVKYFVHLVDINKLVDATNRLWDYKLSGQTIPDTIKNRIILKWGISFEEAQAVKDDLLSINVLGAFDTGVLENFSTTIDSLDLWKSVEISPDLDACQSSCENPEMFSHTPLENSQLFNSDILDYLNLFDEVLPWEASPSLF